MTAIKDYYSILGVSQTATSDEIKKSYRKLAIQYHPDRNPGNKASEDKFKEITEAYDILSNDTERASYDYSRKPKPNSFEGSNYEDIFRYTTNTDGWSFYDEDDILKNFSKMYDQRKTKIKADSITVNVSISFEESILGKKVKILFHRNEKHKSNVQRTLVLNLKSGISDGETLTIKKEGNKDADIPGDLFIRIIVTPHKYFTRENNIIHVKIPVSITQAYYGSEFKIKSPIPDKSIVLTIPHITSDYSCAIPMEYNKFKFYFKITFVISIPKVNSDFDAAMNELNKMFPDLTNTNPEPIQNS